MSTDTISAVIAPTTRSAGSALAPENPSSATPASADFKKELAAAVQDSQGVRNSPAQEQSLPPGKEQTDPEEVEQAVREIKSYVQTLQRDLQFDVDLELGHTVISVVDRETKEVIRQIPPEEAVERAKKLQEEGSLLGGKEGLLLKVQA